MLMNAPMQDRMHLDCVFSIIGDDVCIMMDEMMGEDSPTRRLVDEWVQVKMLFDCRESVVQPGREMFHAARGVITGACLWCVWHSFSRRRLSLYQIDSCAEPLMH